MVVRALSEGGDDVDKMVTALEGWTFAGPKGAMEIRAADHALLQPMFTAKLVKEGSGFVPPARRDAGPGRRGAARRPDEVSDVRAPAVAAEGIGWRVGGAQILDDVTLEVRPGELVGIIGPNGAGKSSLLNILSGVLRPTTGRVSLGGQDVTRRSATRRARLGLARSFQTSALFDGLPASENVRLALQASRGGAVEPLAVRPSVRGRGHRRGAARTEFVCPARAPCRPAGSRTATVASSSSRWRWRRSRRSCSSTSRWPGSPPRTSRACGTIIGEVRDAGVAVAMVEHHMDVVLGLADRVAVLHHGQLLAVGTADEVTGDERVQQAYLGEAL